MAIKPKRIGQNILKNTKKKNRELNQCQNIYLNEIYKKYCDYLENAESYHRLTTNL